MAQRFIPGRRWGDRPPPRAEQPALPFTRKGRKPPPRLDAGALYEGIAFSRAVSPEEATQQAGDRRAIGAWVEVAWRAPKPKGQYGGGFHVRGSLIAHGHVKRWRRYVERAYFLLPWEIRTGPLRATGRRRLVVTRSYRSIPLDDGDNLEGIAKPIRDALVHHGWLVDDSAKWLDREVRQVKDSRPWTRVEVYFAEVPR